MLVGRRGFFSVLAYRALDVRLARRRKTRLQTGKRAIPINVECSLNVATLHTTENYNLLTAGAKVIEHVSVQQDSRKLLQ